MTVMILLLILVAFLLFNSFWRMWFIGPCQTCEHPEVLHIYYDHHTTFGCLHRLGSSIEECGCRNYQHPTFMEAVNRFLGWQK